MYHIFICFKSTNQWFLLFFLLTELCKHFCAVTLVCSIIPKTLLVTAVTSYSQLKPQKIANILTVSKDLFFSGHLHKYMHASLLSVIGLFETLWPLACQDPLSIWFSQKEYWNGLPFTLSKDLLDPGTEPVSPVLQANSILLTHEESPFT